VLLDRALTTALAREPAQRFESAAAFAAALVARATDARDHAHAAHEPTRPAASRARMLVVLPFVNRSAEPDSEYFSDGLTDEVIADLSRVAALRVISRNSAMALKGTTKDTATLARELGVTHLVTGTVRRAGQSLRITAELVDASTDTPIWAEKFSGSMDDVFGIQESISKRIVTALEVRLSASEELAVAERPIDDPVAYDSYLRACHIMFQWTPDAQRRAVRLVDQAIAIAGEVPLLLAMKGQLEWNKVNIPIDPAELGGRDPAALAEQALARATELADRALALDSDAYLAIFVRGLVAGTRGQPEAGLVDLHRAHSLRPGDANVLLELGRYSFAAGIDCKETADEMVAIDPLIPQSHLLVAMYHGLYGPVEKAAAPARRSIELAPDASLLQVSAAWWLATAGHRTEAVAILDGMRSFADLRGAFASFLRSALVGDEEGALRAATPEVERVLTNEFLCVMMASGYALLGRREEALRALHSAVRLGFINYPTLTANATLSSCLSAEPAFQALLAEIEPRWKSVVEWHRALERPHDRTRTLPSGSSGARQRTGN
jgi:TolB-like protein/tetratricopeptide (TPR) repeat protein